MSYIASQIILPASAVEDDFADALSDISDTSYQSDTEFYSINFDLSNGAPFDKNNFTALHYNINSITAEGRIDELTSICNVLNLGVLICTESKLDDTIPNNIISIKGYHDPIRKDRNRDGGGTLVYVADSLVFKQRHDLEEPKFEHIWIDLKIGNSNYCVNTFYRPPDNSNEQQNLFLNTTENILTKITNHQHDNAFIAADLNFGNCYCKFPILTHKPLDSVAPDLFESYGMKQLIDIPTRVTDQSTSLIDLFFVSDLSSVITYGTLPKIADHDGILCSFKNTHSKPKIVTRTVYDYSNVDEVGLRNYINTFNFDTSVFCHPVEYQAEHFTEILQNAFSLYVPTKTVVVRSTEQPWCNTFTRLLLRKKNRNYQFYKKVNSQYISELNRPNPNISLVSRLKTKRDAAFAKSRTAANKSLSANKRTKSNFFNSVNSTMKNNNISAKKKFSILLKLMKNSKHSQIPPLTEGDTVINDSQEKSNLFNSFFSSKSTVPNPNDIPPELEKLQGIPSLNSVSTSPIELSKIIRTGLKKSYISYCGISGKFLNFIATPISKSMSKLFNNLFEEGLYPAIWKLSHVTPIYKRAGPKCGKK